MRVSRWRALSILALLGAAPMGAQTPTGSAFTYQGRLLDSGAPANGSYDLGFKLYDAASGGAVVGSQTIPGVPVAQGLFTVKLDFGTPPFAGQARWLEIQVSPGTGGPTLAPRQELTPSPYTLFSSRTDPANLTDLNASNLTSGTVPDARLSGAYSQALSLANPGNALTGTLAGNGSAVTGLNASNLASGTVPDGRVSGTYSSSLTLSSPGNFFTGDGSGLTNLNAQPKYARTAVVSPIGAPAANGSALLAALAGITTASAANPWLLKIEPGIYDLGAVSFVMKPFVDVEGSGETSTRILGSGHATNDIGTVQAVTSSELRFLTVENTGGSAYAKALYVNGATPRITHVTLLSSGGTSETQGLYSDLGAMPAVSDVTVSVSAPAAAASFAVLDVGSSAQYFHVQANANGGAYSRAFFVCCGGAPSLRYSVGVASGAVTENHGLAAYDSSPTLEYFTGIGTGAATNNLGVLLTGPSSSPVLRQVVCRGIGATGTNWGCLTNNGAQPSMAEISADAFGGTTARGLENDSTGGGASLSGIRAGGSGASSESTGVKINNCSPRAIHVEAFANASGVASASGLWIADGAPNVSHLTTTAAADGFSIALRIDGVAAPTLGHVSAAATGTGAPFGLYTSASTSSVSIDDAVISAAGGSQTIGVYLTGTGVLTNVTGTSSGPTQEVGAVVNGPAKLVNVKFVASPGASSATGLQTGNTGLVTVDRSTLSGSGGFSVFNFGNTVRIGASQLVGNANPGSGTLTCIGSYNGSYAAVNASCQ